MTRARSIVHRMSSTPLLHTDVPGHRRWSRAAASRYRPADTSNRTIATLLGVGLSGHLAECRPVSVRTREIILNGLRARP